MDDIEICCRLMHELIIPDRIPGDDIIDSSIFRKYCIDYNTTDSRIYTATVMLFLYLSMTMNVSDIKTCLVNILMNRKNFLEEYDSDYDVDTVVPTDNFIVGKTRYFYDSDYNNDIKDEDENDDTSESDDDVKN